MLAAAVRDLCQPLGRRAGGRGGVLRQQRRRRGAPPPTCGGRSRGDGAHRRARRRSIPRSSRAGAAGHPHHRRRQVAAPPPANAAALDRASRRHDGHRASGGRRLAVSGGWSPNVHLTCHLGGRPVWDDGDRRLRVRATLPPGLAVAGAAAGRFGLAACLADGRGDGGGGGTRDLGLRRARRHRARGRGRARGHRAVLACRTRSRGAAFVDFQNDVTVKDVGIARAGGLSLGRAHEALHDARHGDRPGQDLERHRPRGHGRR